MRRPRVPRRARGRRRTPVRRCAPAVAGLAASTVALSLLAARASAHAGGLRATTADGLAVPAWLFLLTGGAAVGASFVVASMVTDRALVRWAHRWRDPVRVPPGVRRATVAVGRALGLAGLGAVLAVGLLGPTEPLRNLAVLLVWGGWWAGLAATSYLAGNAWPVVNPWRTLAGWLERRRGPDAERWIERLGAPVADRVGTPGGRPAVLGAWTATAGLLGLVWLEVVAPVAGDPRLLAGVVVAYTGVTLAGATALGPERWFREVDPPGRVFRLFGAVAPAGHDGDRLRLRLPGAGLVDHDLARPGDVAFVLALLWATTFDGLVGTPAWRDVATAAVGAGLPAPLVYLLALLAGFGVVVLAYRLAIDRAHATAETYLDRRVLARRFAPAVVAIAAGYHLAHYLGYALSLAPALAGAVVAPAGPPPPALLVLPPWIGAVELLAVLAGHLLAVGVAHAVAYELFPGRLQAVRAQVALTLAMVAYTVASLWIVSQPTVAAPYV